jgi:hypothetical protein
LIPHVALCNGNLDVDSTIASLPQVIVANNVSAFVHSFETNKLIRIMESVLPALFTGCTLSGDQTAMVTAVLNTTCGTWDVVHFTDGTMVTGDLAGCDFLAVDRASVKEYVFAPTEPGLLARVAPSLFAPPTTVSVWTTPRPSIDTLSWTSLTHFLRPAKTLVCDIDATQCVRFRPAGQDQPSLMSVARIAKITVSRI